MVGVVVVQMLAACSEEEARRSNMRHRPVGLGVQGALRSLVEIRCSHGKISGNV